MVLKVTFDLEEKDLKYFRAQMKAAQETAKRAPEDEVVAKAEAMIREVSAGDIPSFVRQRIERLQALIDMVRDEEWNQVAAERKNVLASLAYFADPEDMIADDIPVLGYIDDAIMIELVVTELQHEIEAFRDFCAYRDSEAALHRSAKITRVQYLEAKRRDLHARMRRRRSARSGDSGSSRTRLRLF
jgi:uncharacterized membrane protein YkvA (DUF1232 family)